jgi:hypothetical protein
MMTNFAAAIQAMLDSLRCPFCGEQNSPFVHPITVINGMATCDTCSKSFIVTQGD